MQTKLRISRHGGARPEFDERGEQIESIAARRQINWPVQTANLPAYLIAARLDARPLIRENAERIASSIETIGRLINPIIVTPARHVRDGMEVDGWNTWPASIASMPCRTCCTGRTFHASS